MRVEDCTHKTLQFGSGDYYIFCQDCNSAWGRINWENPQAEYANIDGNPIGLSPESANRGPFIKNGIRKQVE